MKTEKNLVSGRKPQNYRAENGRYIVRHPTQKYNRALYGAPDPESHHRFLLIGGDLPEAILYRSGNAGRIFWGVVCGQSFRPLSRFDDIRAAYDAGMLEYRIGDSACGDMQITLTMLPLARQPGGVFRICLANFPAGARLVTFFGGADGIKSDRAMDAGYYNETNSRQGVAFRAASCAGNRFSFAGNRFTMEYDSHSVAGRFSADGLFRFADGEAMAHGALNMSDAPSARPLIGYTITPDETGRCEFWLALQASSGAGTPPPADPAACYAESLRHRETVCRAFQADTPDAELDAAARAACAAEEGIWLRPVFAHGAWSWNLPLSGWRSLYGPIAMGMHARVRTEGAFFMSLQLNGQNAPWDPAKALSFSSPGFPVRALTDAAGRGKDAGDFGRVPEPDPAFALARQSLHGLFIGKGFLPELPTSLWRAQYDMQEVFFDEMIAEYEWSGDEGFAQELLPHLLCHLDWERRCFDADGDGLYENFANFWASDGMFYSGAGCALASAYNYRACLAAADMRRRMGRDDREYRARAEKIRQAVKSRLWLAAEGHPAECVDDSGNKLVHPAVSVPTIVHCAESGVLDDFQLYQTLQYARHALEWVPVGTGDGELIWNTGWVPYVWSVRDIDYADVLHLSIACYQAGDRATGYRLLRGAVVDSTCRSVSPGAFLCVREGKSIDFADTVSMFSRAVAGGLFGIRPQMPDGTVTVSPALPDEWQHAAIRLPDFSCDCRWDGLTQTVTLSSRKLCRQIFRLPARRARVLSVCVDGRESPWEAEAGIGSPYIRICSESGAAHTVRIRYGGEPLCRADFPAVVAAGEPFELHTHGYRADELYDPQGAVAEWSRQADGNLSVCPAGRMGWHTFFVRLTAGELSLWNPVSLRVTGGLAAVEPTFDPARHSVAFRLENSRGRVAEVTDPAVTAETERRVPPHSRSGRLRLALPQAQPLWPGHNRFAVACGADNVPGAFCDWAIPWPAGARAVMPDLREWYNDRAADIFRHEYRSPRSPACSLQVPLHLFPSDWCVTDASAVRDMHTDRLRELVEGDGILHTDGGIPFRVEPDPASPNVVFVSKWDNFPDRVRIPLHGRGSRLYLLFCGYTNAMQCDVTNAVFRLRYADGTEQPLPLVPPHNFRSLEKGPETERPEDAFCYRGDPACRIRIGRLNRAVDSSGIYAQVLDLPLADRPLESLTLEAVANDMVAGLMGVTIGTL